MNTQTPEKCVYSEDWLNVHSIFLSIQGEGPLVGTPAVFVRLAGCNLACPECDTNYTSGALGQMSILSLLMAIKRASPYIKTVVITGGEPLRQNIRPLVIALSVQEYLVQIETNGTLPVGDLPYSGVLVVCSPKGKVIHPTLIHRLTAIKYVLSSEHIAEDGLPSNMLGRNVMVARPPEHFKGQVYVQPLDEKDDEKNTRNLSATIESCMKHGYILCLQIHKIISME